MTKRRIWSLFSSLPDRLKFWEAQFVQENMGKRIYFSLSAMEYMRAYKTIGMLLLGAALCLTASAQETNCCPQVPQTKLEGFDTNTSTVILRATAQIGTVAASAGTISIRCREITDLGTGRHEFGLVVGLLVNNVPEQEALIDYEELDSLLSALDYLSRVDWSVTSLPSFDAIYTTKGGFRLVAYGSRRTGAIEFVARNFRLNWAPLRLSRDQLAQLRALIDQARAKIEELQKSK